MGIQVRVNELLITDIKQCTNRIMCQISRFSEISFIKKVFTWDFSAKSGLKKEQKNSQPKWPQLLSS